MKIVTQILTRIIDFVGTCCAVLMCLMLINVFYDVVARYLFDNVSIGMQELEWHLFAAMFMFGIGYTLKEDGHVRVDVIYDRLSMKAQAWINIIGSLFLAIPITALILYFGVGYSYEAWEMGEGSADPGGLPHRWVIRSVIPFSSAFVILCALQVVLKQIETLATISSNTSSEASNNKHNQGAS